MNQDLAKRVLHGAVWSLVSGCFFMVLALQIWRVPQHMDEHGSYHTTACNAHPFSRFHHYRESCNGVYDIRVLDWFTFENACPYMGESIDFLFRPFYYLIPGLAAPFVFCLFFWGLSVFALSRMLRVSPGIAFVGCGMNFAFLYHLLHDPETLLPTFLMAFIPLLAVSSMGAAYPVIYGVIAGFLAFMAFEGKLFFAYLTPLIAMLSLGLVYSCYPVNGKTTKRLLLFAVPAAIVSGTLALLLLTGKTPNGVSYWQSQLHMASTYKAADFTAYLKTLWGNFSFFWLDFGNVMHRVYRPLPAGYRTIWQDTGFLTGVFWMIAILTIITALVLEHKQRYLPICLTMFAPVALLASVVTTLLVATNPQAWTHHHYFYAVTPVLFVFTLSLAALWQRRWGRMYAVPVMAVILAFISLSSTYTKTLELPRNHSSAQRDKILWWLRQPDIAPDLAAVHIDWGSYYTAALIGPPEQMVIFMTGVHNRRHLSAIQQDAQEVGRTPVFIRSNRYTDMSTIRKIYGRLNNITPYVIKQAPPNFLTQSACATGLFPQTCARWRTIDNYGHWEIWSAKPKASHGVRRRNEDGARKPRKR